MGVRNSGFIKVLPQTGQDLGSIVSSVKRLATIGCDIYHIQSRVDAKQALACSEIAQPTVQEGELTARFQPDGKSSIIRASE